MPSTYTVSVKTSAPYQVHIGTFLLECTGEIINQVCPCAKRFLIITDTNVGPLYARPVFDSLSKAGLAGSTKVFQAGETHKTLATYSDLIEYCAREQLTRDDIIVALGGGVVGDIAGLVAATYMRGISYIQIPTSLLAMVDSSVGGKTAVNLGYGKNLAGAFWQPKAVLVDVGCLGTLDDDQFYDGCGEVIKHAAIADADLFAELEKTPLTPELLKKDLARVAYLICRNIDIKRAVVESDEREHQMRKLLNFGHTIGHGVEAAQDYKHGHGTCVGIGMVAITSASVTAGVCDESIPQRLCKLLKAHGLSLAFTADAQEVYEEALHDKKRHDDSIDLVVLKNFGEATIAKTSLDDFKRITEVGLACTRALSSEAIKENSCSPE